MPVHTGRLLLTPRNPLLEIHRDKLHQRLRDAGFLAGPLPHPREGFLAGEQFLSLLTFAGCSVQIELAPPANGGPFCHVRILGPYEHPVLMHGRNTRPPRCPNCRAPYRNWKALPLAAQDIADTRLPCPACAREHPFADWDWKGNAGLGRVFVLVEEIFPGEAIPSPGLMTALYRLSGDPWRHFYVQDERIHEPRNDARS